MRSVERIHGLIVSNKTVIPLFFPEYFFGCGRLRNEKRPAIDEDIIAIVVVMPQWSKGSPIP